MEKEQDQVKEEEVKGDVKKEEEEEQKMVPVAELKRRLAKKDVERDEAVAAVKEESKKELAEAEKLRKMNEQEKADYEQKKKDDRIAELEAKINRSELEREASSSMSEAGYHLEADEVALIVEDGATAETVQAKVTALSNLLKRTASEAVEELKRGKTPSATRNTTTQEDKPIEQMTYEELRALKEQNPKKYAELTQ